MGREFRGGRGRGGGGRGGRGGGFRGGRGGGQGGGGFQNFGPPKYLIVNIYFFYYFFAPPPPPKVKILFDFICAFFEMRAPFFRTNV